MNILLDTNIVLYLLAGDEKLIELLHNQILHISFITELELFAYPHLTKSEYNQVKAFTEDCIIVDINHEIKKKTIEIRKNFNLKLPDAIIASTAIIEVMPFISADKKFENVKGLQLFSYEIN